MPVSPVVNISSKNDMPRKSTVGLCFPQIVRHQSTPLPMRAPAALSSIQAKLSPGDAIALLFWAKKKYGEDWMTDPASQLEHRRLVLGCSSLQEAKGQLDISAPKLNFKIVQNVGAPPGWTPIFGDSQPASPRIVPPPSPQLVLAPAPRPLPPPPSFASMAGRLKASDFAPAKMPAARSLKATILGDLAFWRGKAQAKLSTASGKRFYPGEEITVCFMWRPDRSNVFAISGGGTCHSLTPGKKTVCAEDVLLNEHGKMGWKYSLSFDNKYGWKLACSKGCSKLLEDYGIEDLAKSI